MEGHAGRAADRRDDVLGRLLAQARQRRQLLGPEVVEIGGVVQQTVVVEQFDGLLAQRLDVHRLAADEVQDAPENLRAAAVLVRAVVLGLALVAHQRRAALGTVGDVAERHAVGGTLRQLHARDLGDDLAALLDVDHVARPDVELLHLFGVVERGAPHGGAGQQHRRKVRHGGDRSGAPDLEGDALEARERLLGLELVGYGPARRLGREADAAAHGEVVDLDDHAVGREGQLAARRVPVGDEVVDLGARAADAHPVRDLESPRAGLFETLPVGLEGQVVARQLVERAVQSAARHDRRGLLLECARRGVARVGQQRLARCFALGVQAVERGVGHEYLAADFKQIGPVVAAQHERHAADRADVGRHVVARRAVAARHGAQQPAVLVGERDGRAVELQLADELRRTDLAFDAVDELVQLVERIGVSEREHRKAVAHGAEFRRQIAAHALRGRIGIGAFGVGAFEVLKLAHHRVELEIGDLGRILHVVLEIVVFELAAQLLDSLLEHGHTGSLAAADRSPERVSGLAGGSCGGRLCCVKLHILCGTESENKKIAKKNCRCGAVRKFCLYLQKILKHYYG